MVINADNSPAPAGEPKRSWRSRETGTLAPAKGPPARVLFLLERNDKTRAMVAGEEGINALGVDADVGVGASGWISIREMHRILSLTCPFFCVGSILGSFHSVRWLPCHPGSRPRQAQDKGHETARGRDRQPQEAQQGEMEPACAFGLFLHFRYSFLLFFFYTRILQGPGRCRLHSSLARHNWQFAAGLPSNRITHHVLLISSNCRFAFSPYR
ncbi:hypothetical protein GQ53DRAFT_357592 [Thozetella sp. PMI_491]|nr:hypothetical protein GQ53DRAFT_357592 [Thozetella sp. PMI_491]